MNLGKKKRLAAAILKCGENRVWFDPKRLAEIKEAITKADIRGLIKNLAIQKKPYTSHSHARLRQNLIQRKKGRRQGPASRRGKQTARISSKRVWINRIRAQRQVLKELNRRGVITHTLYHTLYEKAKGGFFRSRRHIHLYLEEHGVAKTEHETKAI